jgi:signal transduction histidine kinase
MSILHPRALKTLLLVHETAFLMLVTVTGALGGMWTYFWLESSNELSRVDALLYEAQLVRGDLYRQLKEVVRARGIDDTKALRQYYRHLHSIQRHFSQLKRRAEDEEERYAVKEMQTAYSRVQDEMNMIFTDPQLAGENARFRILDPEYEAWLLKGFEQTFRQFYELITGRREKMELDLERWTTLAPIVIPVPIVLAALLLWFSHRSLQRDFVRPMSAVAHGAKRISEGYFDHRIPEHGVEEVTQLARSINDMARDLADSRNALVESERQAALGALVPVVAHNIRNPIAGIRAAAQMIDYVDESVDSQDSRQAIIDTVDRLERWVSSLLSYLHPLQPHRTRSRLSKLLDDVLLTMRSKFEEKELHLNRRGWQTDPDLYIDVDLIEQAVYGLILNATEASPQGGEITLTVEPSTSSVNLTIEDQGSGLAFDPKPGSLSPGPTTKRLGTGLGIPFAFKVCHAHGGTIVFVQNSPTGTRVRIDLPTGAPLVTES